ncbi:hypothetical protein [Treponema phagedenis]|uniref:hypothetical protein n=1 Tax=Treponema phagedenis TaxID=162 RepID=UPI0004B802B5|nr:hypothetical protein [Treponema phagedenis]NVP23465.1 hypothetical protein [Treponema phagedenis]
MRFELGTKPALPESNTGTNRRRTAGSACAAAILRQKLLPQNDPARIFEKMLRRPPYA